MSKEPWNGNIDTADESQEETVSETGYDGNREYSNGTYGQSDYTVRERGNSGIYDVYIESDSEKGHSHDVIDSEGNLIASYHDFLCRYLELLSYEELQLLEATAKSEYLKRSARVFLEKSRIYNFEFINVRFGMKF